MIAELNDLLDAEVNSVFAYLGHSTPYLDRAHAPMRKVLASLVLNSQRRAERLVRLIESLEGSPIVRGLQKGEQHLAYLTIQFLLPQLIEAKQRDLQRYTRVKTIAHGEAIAVIDAMIMELTEELGALRKS